MEIVYSNEFTFDPCSFHELVDIINNEWTTFVAKGYTKIKFELSQNDEGQPILMITGVIDI